MELSIKYLQKIFWKTNISYPLIRIRKSWILRDAMKISFLGFICISVWASQNLNFSSFLQWMFRSSCPEAFCEKGVLENSQNSQENTCTIVSFLKSQASACNFIKKEALAQVFSCEFCEISKNTFSCRTPPVAVSQCSDNP